MPRKIDPATIKVGHGLAGSDSVEVNALIPGTGEPGSVGGAGAGSTAHIQDEHDAHPASAVSVDDVPKIYDAANVEGVLDELAALVPPRPPTIGHALHYFETTCIPDWGILKLDDATWFLRCQAQLDPESLWFNHLDRFTGEPSEDTGMEVYPYFWEAVRPAKDFRPKANDPVTDPIFNVTDASYMGGGVGVSHAGWFLRDNSLVANTRMPIPTHRVIPSSGEEGGKEVVVSGVVFPADRGTLALIRFNTSGTFEPHSTDPDDFKKVRVLAALNLGQGIFDKCDGHPGGIFWLGEHGGDCAPYSYDPFTFPGRATGQLDLWEIHTGMIRKKGAAPVDLDILHPFWDFDGDGNQGAPAAGQVRLGTDPNAGIPLITDGIPILGGTTAARGGGHDQNFFRYRLPYLVDYSKPHGLKWTPPEELHRFYDKPDVALDEANALEEAGDYRGFEKDYWTYQVARYRHQFTLPDDIILEHSPRDCGTYVLVHFRKEEYFEDCVRDGSLPTAEKIYSANLVTWDDVGHYSNVANPISISDNESPKHAPSYHVLRSNVYEDILGDKDSEFCPGPVPPIIDGEGQHEIARIDLHPGSVMKVSGVRYLISGPFDGEYNTHWENLSVLLKAPDHHNNVYGLFETSFLTHGDDPEGLAVDIPGMEDGDRLMSQRFPAFLSFFSFTGEPGHLSHQLVANPPLPLSNHTRGRCDFSMPNLIGGIPSFPVPEKDTQAHMQGMVAAVYGDEFPKFSRDAVFRAFFRRPLNHGRHFLDYAKFYNTGIKVQSYVEQKPVQVLWHGSNHLKTREEPLRFSNYEWDEIVDENIYNEDKDGREYFLDESYRLKGDFRNPAGDLALSLPYTETLCGPGLPHGTGLKITIPHTAAEAASSPWKEIHWMTVEYNIGNLSTQLIRELQVAGWPDRNPPMEDGVYDPTQRSGVLIYPQHDYSACIPAGPDYSGAVSGPRCWVRYFNIGSEGDSKVDVLLEGIKLEDFAWEAPDEGSHKMAILIKVPGQTTWMDVGRRDGEGPSKQDPFADGAGCMIIGPHTKDEGPHPLYGTQRCRVRCNLGPSASLYENANGQTQLLMKVVIYPNGMDLNLEQGGPDGTVRDIRGLTGVAVEGVR